jgi:hypothetical protein
MAVLFKALASIPAVLVYTISPCSDISPNLSRRLEANHNKLHAS